MSVDSITTTVYQTTSSSTSFYLTVYDPATGQYSYVTVPAVVEAVKSTEQEKADAAPEPKAEQSDPTYEALAKYWDEHG